MDSKEEQQLKEEEEEEEEEEHNDDNFHVLAVDDSIIDRKILEKLLTLSSCHVTCVESGDKALEYLGLVDHQTPSIIDDANHDHDHHHHHSDLHLLPPLHHQEGQGSRVNMIMTDYSMPGITGYELLKKVKGSSWKDIPVVVMSSENVPSRIHMCLEGGAKEFLLKPVRLSDLKKLHPHLLKSTLTNKSQCCGNNSRNKKEVLAERRCNLGANDSHSYDHKQEIVIRDLIN